MKRIEVGKNRLNRLNRLTSNPLTNLRFFGGIARILAYWLSVPVGLPAGYGGAQQPQHGLRLP